MNEMILLFQVMPHNSPTLCIEGGEFGPLLEVVWLHIHPLFKGDFRQCPLVVSRGSRATIVSAALSRLDLWRQVCVLILMENMRLHTDPLSRPYTKYLLRVDNGQEFSIIDHFPSEANAEPLRRVEITLYPEIHQAPSLDTLIHVVFPALAINYTN
jgi:hypothetical protein